VLISGLLAVLAGARRFEPIAKLLSIVQIKAAVMRDGNSKEIPIEEIVPGDSLS